MGRHAHQIAAQPHVIAQPANVRRRDKLAGQKVIGAKPPATFDPTEPQFALATHRRRPRLAGRWSWLGINDARGLLEIFSPTNHRAVYPAGKSHISEARMPPFVRRFGAVAGDPGAIGAKQSWILAVPHMRQSRVAMVGDAAFISRPHTAATPQAVANVRALGATLVHHQLDINAALQEWEPRGNSILGRRLLL
jgi:hypothetical protein